MRQIIVLFFLGSVLFSCKKDKVPTPCSGIEMSGERSKLLGTWQWYNTKVSQTFASGNTYFFDYTPISEGYSYYFTISEEGRYRGYKDSVLVHEHWISRALSEDLTHPNTQYLEVAIDCRKKSRLQFVFPSQTYTFDTLKVWEYPIRFDDEQTNKHSQMNFFKKQ